MGSLDMSSTESERMCPACGSTPVWGGMEGQVKRLPPTLTMVSLMIAHVLTNKAYLFIGDKNVMEETERP